MKNNRREFEALNVTRIIKGRKEKVGLKKKVKKESIKGLVENDLARRKRLKTEIRDLGRFSERKDLEKPSIPQLNKYSSV